MAVIVAFGDSNTWGYDPATATRFPPDVRWTGVMRRELGDGHSWRASPMTYLAGGKQYVAVAAGPNILCFGLR